MRLNKKGEEITMPEIVKLVIAVIALTLLIILMVKLYGLFKTKTAYEQAQETLKQIVAKIEYMEKQGIKSSDYLITGPKNWYLVYDSYMDKHFLYICPDINKENCQKQGIWQPVNKKVDLFFNGEFCWRSSPLVTAGAQDIRIVNENERIIVGEPFILPQENIQALLDRRLFSYSEKLRIPDFWSIDRIGVENMLEKEKTSLNKEGFVNDLMVSAKGDSIHPLLIFSVVKQKYGLFENLEIQKLNEEIYKKAQEEINIGKSLGIDCEDYVASGAPGNAWLTITSCISTILRQGYDGKAGETGYAEDNEIQVSGRIIKPENTATAVLYWYIKDFDLAVKITQQILDYRGERGAALAEEKRC